MNNLFDTHSHEWAEAGLRREVDAQLVRRARRETFLLVPVIAALIAAFLHSDDLLGKGARTNTALDIGTAIVLVVLGWWIARDIGRALAPALLRQMDPATAGTVGFLIRLVTLGVVLIGALTIAGVDSGTIALGGGFTVIVLGLAAQQTLGNLIAGTVLLSARPFRVGDQVRLQGGPLAGRVEGIVSALGLLYTTLNDGEDRVMVPNSVVLNVAVTPLREPESVNLKARLRADITPAELERLIAAGVHTPTRSSATVTMEELDGEELVVNIEATPLYGKDGTQLASELLEVVSRETISETTS